MAISLQKIPLAAWSLLTSQRQDFLNNQLARVPVTPNHKGTVEMKDEIRSSVGAQKMNTSRYQVSDLDDVEFFWEKDRLDVDAVFRLALIPPFHQQHLTTWRWEVQQETSFCSTKRSTRRTLFQQHQSLRDQHDPLHCSEVVQLQQE